MESKKIGRQTVRFSRPPAVLSFGSAAGEKESSGPLGQCFDYASQDDTFGQKSWEKAETAMQRQALSIALEQGGLEAEQLDLLLAGDLLNQCIATSYSVRALHTPFFGLYGACSTMAEGLSLAAMLLDGGFGSRVAALTSSHFCSAERQYRNPLEYGGQKPPTAQWTATGSGAVILGREGAGPYLTHVTAGRVVDWGITDANNMGAAMAPNSVRLAPYPTIWGNLLIFSTKVTSRQGGILSQFTNPIFRRRNDFVEKNLKNRSITASAAVTRETTTSLC